MFIEFSLKIIKKMAIDSPISMHDSSLKELDFLIGPYNQSLVSLRNTSYEVH